MSQVWHAAAEGMPGAMGGMPRGAAGAAHAVVAWYGMVCAVVQCGRCQRRALCYAARRLLLFSAHRGKQQLRMQQRRYPMAR